MRYIENIVVGEPLVHPAEIFAKDKADWEQNEKAKTHFTDELYLPRILVEIGIYPSVAEIRRNRRDLLIWLKPPSFIERLRVSRRRQVSILVG